MYFEKSQSIYEIVKKPDGNRGWEQYSWVVHGRLTSSNSNGILITIVLIFKNTDLDIVFVKVGFN